MIVTARQGRRKLFFLMMTWNTSGWRETLVYAQFDPPLETTLLEHQPVAGRTGVVVDISPDDFVRLVLPVYKAMFAHMPNSAMLGSTQFKQQANELLRAVAMRRQYTSVSFGRLLVLAGRRLRLTETHHEAALEAVHRNSGLILATNLRPEQVS